MPSDAKYLVTGGSGFLGSALVRALVDRGESVRVLDNHFRGSRDRIGEDYLDRIELIEGDVRDPDAMRQAVHGVETVCHLASINGTRYFYEMPQTVLEVGVRGTLNALEASLAAGVRDFAFASSSEIYQTPPSIPTDENAPASIPDVLNPRYSYAGAKLIGELLSLNFGRKKFRRTLVFRPHNVYGPAMGMEHVIPEFIVRLKKASWSGADPVDFPIQGDGEQTRAFTYVEDFTRGLLTILDRGEDQNVYHIGSDHEVSIRDLAERVAAWFGVTVRLVPSEEPAGGTRRRCPDIAKLRALGFELQFPLDRGLEQTIRWYEAWAESHREA